MNTLKRTGHVLLGAAVGILFLAVAVPLAIIADFRGVFRLVENFGEECVKAIKQLAR